MVSAARTPLFTLLPKQNTWGLFSTALPQLLPSSPVQLPALQLSSDNASQCEPGCKKYPSESSNCSRKRLPTFLKCCVCSEGAETHPDLPHQKLGVGNLPKSFSVGWLLQPALALLCCHILIHILLSPPDSLLQSSTRSCSAP